LKKSPEREPAAFVLSVSVAVGFLGIFAVITGAEYILALFLHGSSSTLVLVGFVILLAFAVRLWLFDLKTATFYDDKVEIVGRGYRLSVGYQKIRKVAKVKVLPLFAPRTQVHLYVEGREKPVVIPWNPMSRQTKVDLYSWLTEKPNLRRFRE